MNAACVLPCAEAMVPRVVALLSLPGSMSSGLHVLVIGALNGVPV